MSRINITLSLNQQNYTLSVDRVSPLLDQVRHYLNLVSERENE
jgi:aerobic-type carbon monoxide dehydrogenase small subunit (CoxS/CutS family)